MENFPWLFSKKALTLAAILLQLTKIMYILVRATHSFICISTIEFYMEIQQIFLILEEYEMHNSAQEEGT